jgi:hypothetical protein
MPEYVYTAIIDGKKTVWTHNELEIPNIFGQLIGIYHTEKNSIYCELIQKNGRLTRKFVEKGENILFGLEDVKTVSQITCSGCIYDILNQEGHMYVGGCLI